MKLHFVFFLLQGKEGKKKKLSSLAFPQKCLEFKQNTCGVVNENKHASQSMSCGLYSKVQADVFICPPFRGGDLSWGQR